MKIPLRPPTVIVRPEAAAPVAIEVEAPAEAVAPRFVLRHLMWRAALWSFVGFGIQTLASTVPELVEAGYSRVVYYYIVRFQAIVNQFFPFSLGETFFIGLGLYFLAWTLWYMRRASRRESRLWDVWRLFFLHLLWTFSVLFLFFLLLWGLNYQRMHIAESLGLERPPTRTDELQNVGARILNGINSNYDLALREQDISSPTRLPYTHQVLLRNLENAFQKTAMIGNASQGGVGFPKPLLLSRLASWLGITGIYMPYTGEATYNIEVPPSQLPFVIAHQKAHQRGYAREDEANFVAYVVCTKADDPYLRYTGYLHGVKVLYALEQSGIGRYTESIGPGPSADLDQQMRFWGAVKNPTFSGLTREVVNAYLRANRVSRGYKNSNDDVGLIVSYLIKNRAVDENQSPIP
jgi:Protein of unknown function (DUF3810)